MRFASCQFASATGAPVSDNHASRGMPKSSFNVAARTERGLASSCRNESSLPSSCVCWFPSCSSRSASSSVINDKALLLKVWRCTSVRSDAHVVFLSKVAAEAMSVRYGMPKLMITANRPIIRMVTGEVGII